MQFLEYFADPVIWDTPKIICFKSTLYPVLFLSFLRTRLRTRYTKQVKVVDLQDMSLIQLQLELSTSFLGMPTLYWILYSEAITPSLQQELLEYFATYEGPHTLLFFMHESKQLPSSIITSLLPAKIQHAQALELIRFFQDKKIDAPFYERIFARHSSLSLDTVCILMQYQPLLGRNSTFFIEQWLDILVAEKKSLFTLSQYFFAKQNTLFFLLLQQVHKEYPSEFWISYWSDQLWQAFHFLWYAHQGNTVEGKKNVSRLPFSFIQKEWRAYTLKELSNAHHYLSTIDFALKNGGSESIVDLFYAKFLHGHFKTVYQAPCSIINCGTQAAV